MKRTVFTSKGKTRFCHMSQRETFLARTARYKIYYTYERDITVANPGKGIVSMAILKLISLQKLLTCMSKIYL